MDHSCHLSGSYYMLGVKYALLEFFLYFKIGAKPSVVLEAIGVSEDLASASLRIGLGRFTTAEEVDFAANKIVEVVLQLRG